MKIYPAVLSVFVFLCFFVFISCKPEPESPVVNEKIDPDSIAPDHLIAYFPFDENATDVIDSLFPVLQPSNGFVGGKRKKAFQGAVNTYLLYNLPETSKLRSLENGFSIAMWIKAGKVTQRVYPKIIEFCLPQNPVNGNFSWIQEDLEAKYDELLFKWQFVGSGESHLINDTLLKSDVFIHKKWMHLILSFNVESDAFTIYKDGEIIKSLETKLNNIRFDFSKTSQLLIGTWMPRVSRLDIIEDPDNPVKELEPQSWMGWFEGNLDELRIYNKGLSEIEAAELYEAELSQVN